MALSKRETVILAATGVIAAVLIGDWAIVSPLLAAREDAQGRLKALSARRIRDNAVLRENRQLTRRWKEMVAAGIKDEDDEAVSQVLHAVRDWADNAGVSLSNLQRERQTEKTPLPTIGFHVAGTGSMESIAKLLWRMQNATIPVRVTELQIAARTEGTDDLTMEMRLSTVYQPGSAGGAQTGAASKGVE